MPRIRTITAAGVFAGATVLGGAGLAGATGGSDEPRDPAVEVADDPQRAAAELTMGEPEAPTDGPSDDTGAPRAPVLPEQASDRSSEALGAAPAFADGGDASAQDTDVPADAPADAPSETGNHGHQVSETARSTEPGPGHGQTVSEVARSNGEAQRSADGPAADADDEGAEEDVPVQD